MDQKQHEILHSLLGMENPLWEARDMIRAIVVMADKGIAQGLSKEDSQALSRVALAALDSAQNAEKVLASTTDLIPRG